VIWDEEIIAEIAVSNSAQKVDMCSCTWLHRDTQYCLIMVRISL